MYNLEVIADKLNIRSTPEADLSFANWVGDMVKGETYTALKIVKGGIFEGTDNWFVDQNNLFTSAFGVKTEYQNWMIDLRLPEIWEHFTGKGVGVAVIDTGIAEDIEDLPFSKIKQFTYAPLVSLKDFDGHGTNCSGLIGARNAHGKYIGTAPECNLFICKIAERGDFDDPSKDTVRYADAINWCANQPEIHVISISWGHVIDDEEIKSKIQNSINSALNQNKIIVCSIGDAFKWIDNTKIFPACFTNTIGIGSIPVLNTIYPFVNEHLSIVTVGTNIFSYGVDENSRNLSGTSQSNAICAGIIALLIQKIGGSFTSAKVKDLLSNASREVTYTIKNKNETLRVLDGDLLLEIFKS